MKQRLFVRPGWGKAGQSLLCSRVGYVRMRTDTERVNLKSENGGWKEGEIPVMAKKRAEKMHQNKIWLFFWY